MKPRRATDVCLFCLFLGKWEQAYLSAVSVCPALLGRRCQHCRVAAADTSPGELHVLCAHRQLLREASVPLGVLPASCKPVAMGLIAEPGPGGAEHDPLSYRGQESCHQEGGTT